MTAADEGPFTIVMMKKNRKPPKIRLASTRNDHSRLFFSRILFSEVGNHKILNNLLSGFSTSRDLSIIAQPNHHTLLDISPEPHKDFLLILKYVCKPHAKGQQPWQTQL